ncbi:PRC-barrel domain-containing protein [Rhizobium sp. TRM95796]|uniref:PRC-barrel domain-containing protein n=1 Tax=Rhizobium sp. TRM95796 TaxID=2979862 RepID=UPI0021E95E2B|nr:PRC-barrel domain-containing protein [Rhizobium sp. TRM95796]MCV3764968.1 PRC-barrel domain-containing protein [Rhizobium sp. TRM95796]
MKSFLATTAIVLVMGGSAFAQSSDQSTTAPAATTGESMQFSSYQAGPNDVRASEFIGQRIYATEQAMAADQAVQPGAERDWDDVGEINEVLMDRQGDVKAVVLGVGGFLGIGEKNVAVPMDQVKFVKNGDGADDYFLVINANKQALNDAPAWTAPEETASNAPAADATGNTMATAPAATAPAATGAASTDMTAANGNNTGMNSGVDTQAANTPATATPPAADQAQTDAAAQQDMQTTASTNTENATDTAMTDNRTRLTPPTVTRDGYETAQPTELTAEKLQGATVYGPKDEDVATINRLVMNEQGQIQDVVLDVGGFLGIGAREIAVSPEELNIMRNTKGDDVRVYIDANKDTLKAQPEYKAAAK